MILEDYLNDLVWMAGKYMKANLKACNYCGYTVEDPRFIECPYCLNQLYQGDFAFGHNISSLVDGRIEKLAFKRPLSCRQINRALKLCDGYIDWFVKCHPDHMKSLREDVLAK